MGLKGFFFFFLFILGDQCCLVGLFSIFAVSFFGDYAFFVYEFILLSCRFEAFRSEALREEAWVLSKACS